MNTNIRIDPPAPKRFIKQWMINNNIWNVIIETKNYSQEYTTNIRFENNAQLDIKNFRDHWFDTNGKIKMVVIDCPINKKEFYEIKDWLEENISAIGFKWDVIANKYFFIDEIDAMAFKLTWC